MSTIFTFGDMEDVVVGPQSFEERLAPSGVKDREASGGGGWHLSKGQKRTWLRKGRQGYSRWESGSRRGQE